MSTDTADPVLAQLKKLREGPGLTVDRLRDSGAVMSALATSDPLDAYNGLVELIDGMGNTDRGRALQVDFGLNLATLLGDSPSGREREWLGTRRASYAVIVRRDVKTLARWSNKAIAELRNHLLTDTFTGHLYVVAAVKGNRIAGCTIFREPAESGAAGAAERVSVDETNAADGPSLPCLLYAFPRDWSPASLTLAATFIEPPHPSEAWVIVAESFFDLSFGHERHVLATSGDTVTCRIVAPRRDRLYGLWWHHGDS